jgi:hypothetical protein
MDIPGVKRVAVSYNYLKRAHLLLLLLLLLYLTTPHHLQSLFVEYMQYVFQFLPLRA